MLLPIHYLALHEIFPDFGPVGNGLIGFTMLAGVAGVLVVLPLLVFARRRPSSTRRRVPVFLLLSLGYGIGAALTLLVRDGAIFIFASLWFTGHATNLWWIYDRLRPRVATLTESPAEPPVRPPTVEARAAIDTCDGCREAATAGGGEPLSRIAHNADGPRFLYRCTQCHSYWEKDVRGMRPISVLRVRHEFPTVVI